MDLGWAPASLSRQTGSANRVLWVQSANSDGFYSGVTSAVSLRLMTPTSSARLFTAVPLHLPILSESACAGLFRPSLKAGFMPARVRPPPKVQSPLTGITANPTCAADVSSQVTVARGGWKFQSRTTNSYAETLTLTNTGSSPVGPVSLVFDSLSSYATVTSGSGTTTCGALTGSFYQSPTGAGMLNPGQSVPRLSDSYQFVNPNDRIQHPSLVWRRVFAKKESEMSLNRIKYLLPVLLCSAFAMGKAQATIVDVSLDTTFLAGLGAPFTFPPYYLDFQFVAGDTSEPSPNSALTVIGTGGQFNDFTLTAVTGSRIRRESRSHSH